MQTKTRWSSFYNSNCFNNLTTYYNLCALVGQNKDFDISVSCFRCNTFLLQYLSNPCKHFSFLCHALHITYPSLTPLFDHANNIWRGLLQGHDVFKWQTSVPISYVYGVSKKQRSETDSKRLCNIVQCQRIWKVSVKFLWDTFYFSGGHYWRIGYKLGRRMCQNLENDKTKRTST
jgi:hypothetical protein